MICITHLPQVASLAAAHFRIAKRVAGGPDAGRASSASTATSWSPRSCACWAASAATRPPTATPESCWRPPEPGAAAWARPRDRSFRIIGGAHASSARERRRRFSPRQPTAGAGPPGADPRDREARSQDEGAGQAARPGDVAIIDHADLDRIAAEDLVASGVQAVVNVAPSSTGRYPNAGPAAARAGGRAPGRRRRRRRCSRSFATATRSTIARRRGAPQRSVLAAGEELTVADLRGRLSEQRARVDEALARLRREHDRPRPRGGRAARRAGSSCRRPEPSSATATS